MRCNATVARAFEPRGNEQRRASRRSVRDEPRVLLNALLGSSRCVPERWRRVTTAGLSRKRIALDCECTRFAVLGFDRIGEAAPRDSERTRRERELFG